MKKELVIEVEEECLICPNLSLSTSTIYSDGEATFKIHQCEHLEFCKRVRQAWEKVHKQRVID